MKTTTRLLLSILLVFTVCICSCTVPSFGPRLSHAAALHESGLGMITETDIITPPTVNETNSTTQVKNILAVTSLTTGAIQTINFRMRVFPFLTISDTDFKFYNYKSEDESILTVTDTTDTDGYLTVSYRPYGTQYSGIAFLYCGYNTTDDVAEAKRAIVHTVISGTLPEGIVLNSADNYALTTTTILMGDVNNDNAVTASDQNLISSGISAPSSLTTQQFLAADVTMDGTISSKDLLLFMQYLNGSKSSFWGTDGIVPLASATIENGAHHKLYNKGDECYMLAYSSSDNISMGLPGGNIVTSNFIINSGSLCTIENIFSGKYLAVNADGSLTHAITTTDFSQFWYIVKFNDNYYLVNYAYNDKLLTADLKLTRSLYKAQWDLQPQTVTVDYYYNYGYRYRFWENWDSNDTVAKTSSQVDTAIVNELQEYQTKIDRVITNTFDISVTMNMPELILSREDLCYAPNGSPTFSQMAAAIGTSQVANGSTNTAICNHTASSIGSNGTYHHRNASLGLEYMYQEKADNEESDHIYLLTSGYEPCHECTTNSNGTITHNYGTIAGLASPSDNVVGVYHAQQGNTYKNSLTALHELCHCLGAGGKADTKHGSLCIMSYNRSDSDLLTIMNTPGLTTYRSLFCDDCYNAIVNKLRFQ